MDNHKIAQFLDHFEEQWLSTYKFWYEGAAIGYPSTNNGSIEATNAVIFYLKIHYFTVKNAFSAVHFTYLP